MVFVSSHLHRERKDDVACSQLLAGGLKVSLSMCEMQSSFCVLAAARDSQLLVGMGQNCGRVTRFGSNLFIPSQAA